MVLSCWNKSGCVELLWYILYIEFSMVGCIMTNLVEADSVFLSFCFPSGLGSSVSENGGARCGCCICVFGSEVIIIWVLLFPW